LTTLLKLGGELLEDAAAIGGAATAILRLAASGPVVIVHGGGRAIDAELRRRGLTPRFADGLRITDADTLDAVVMVLAGRANTQLVAAINAVGGRAVGLTGADARLGLCVPSPPVKTQAGEIVELGLVGEPSASKPALIEELLRLSYLPVVASIGTTAEGALLNVNADTFAAHLAATIGASRLIIAGATVGVLDDSGQTIPTLTVDDVDALTASGTAHSGMVAKLAACRLAATRGVAEVSIVAGRGAVDFESAPGTRLQAAVAPAARARREDAERERAGVGPREH
jgi:acetylglutamate kinase